MAVTAHADEQFALVHRVVSAAVDPQFYRTIYEDLPGEIGPLWHYVAQGWREGRDPAPWFSTHAYLQDHPDVAADDVEPLFHFLTAGWRQGREVRPSHHAIDYQRRISWAPKAWGFEGFAVGPPPAVAASVAARPQVHPISKAEQRSAVAVEFDSAFYLALNPDVADSGITPLDHFLTAGWLEGRDPNAWFSLRDYLEAYPDVAAAGLNPLAHYVIAGRAEGRAPRTDLGFRYDVLARMKPVDGRIAGAVGASRRTATQSAAVLAIELGQLGDLHVTFSHDNYLENSGGLQQCVRRESARFAARGIDHLHLFPAEPWPTVRAADEPGPLGVLLNGRSLGLFEPRAVAEAVARAAAPAGGRRSFAIHSLLGHGADDTADILAAAGLAEGFFWLHDFASLCAGFHLLRDDVEDCAAPPADSAACAICAYGPHRARHEAAHGRLFERLALTVVAPSQTTLGFWRAHTGLPAAATTILPHARLAPRRAAARPARDGRFRLAFLGMPSALKGWPVFRDIARQFADDPRYEFLHLGGRPDPAAPAAFHLVVVGAERPDAMADAVAALDVDAALLWPLCRETFSFTAYEAAAGGAAVITGPDSGNVAAFAADPAVGRVLPDEAALAEAFASGAILELGRDRRKAVRFRLDYSGLTSDLVAEPAA